MAGNTTFDQAEVESKAKAHDELRQTIEQDLTSLRGRIDSVQQSSKSELTTKLLEKYEMDIEELKKRVLEDLSSMSNDMRSVVGNQVEQDSSASNPVMSAEMGGFLG